MKFADPDPILHDFVEASSIPSVLSHLRSQPINDIDGMLLSKVGLRKLLPFSGGSRRDVSSPHGYGCQENLKKFGKTPMRGASFFLQKNVFECPKLSANS